MAAGRGCTFVKVLDSRRSGALVLEAADSQGMIQTQALDDVAQSLGFQTQLEYLEMLERLGPGIYDLWYPQATGVADGQ